jgi:hypothetical protein
LLMFGLKIPIMPNSSSDAEGLDIRLQNNSSACDFVGQSNGFLIWRKKIPRKISEPK